MRYKEAGLNGLLRAIYGVEEPSQVQILPNGEIKFGRVKADTWLCVWSSMAEIYESAVRINELYRDVSAYLPDLRRACGVKAPESLICIECGKDCEPKEYHGDSRCDNCNWHALMDDPHMREMLDNAQAEMMDIDYPDVDD